MLIATPARREPRVSERETNRVVVRLRAAVRRPPRPPSRAAMASATRDALGTMDRDVVKDGVLHAAPCCSRALSDLAGQDVYIKLDDLQPSGSFKLRGIGYTCQKAVAEGARCLISSSGGNAGLATAYAGQRLGAPTTVVVPETTPEFIRDRLRSYGATVEVHGSQWSEANERAVALCAAADGQLAEPL